MKIIKILLIFVFIFSINAYGISDVPVLDIVNCQPDNNGVVSIEGIMHNGLKNWELGVVVYNKNDRTNYIYLNQTRALAPLVDRECLFAFENFKMPENAYGTYTVEVSGTNLPVVTKEFTYLAPTPKYVESEKCLINEENKLEVKGKLKNSPYVSFVDISVVDSKTNEIVLTDTIQAQGPDIFGDCEFSKMYEINSAFLKSGIYIVEIGALGVNSLRKTVVYNKPIEYYVSPNGDDKNVGDILSPFKTIQKARDTIRNYQYENAGLSQNVIVYLRGGMYYVPTQITFSDEDSGTNGYNITYCGYENEKIVLCSGMKLDGWKKNNNVWTTEVPKGYNVGAIYENGKSGILSRYPDNGYNKVAKQAEISQSKSSFYINSNDIVSVYDSSSLEVSVWSGGNDGEWNWSEQIAKVSLIDKSDIFYKVNLSSATAYNIGKGSRYYFRGAKEFLNTTGEFYFDKNTCVLSYIPYENITPKSVITIPANNPVIHFVGKSADKKVSNIKISNISITGTNRDTDGIFLENSENITIDKCRVYCVGGNGIYGAGNISNCVFSSNEISDTADCGIKLSGLNNPNTFINCDNTITNNYIHNIGKIYGHASGIDFTCSARNVISHNLINSSRRCGINFGASGCKDNIIKYNDISDCMNDSQDGAAIYCWGAGGGNTISNNAVHDYEVPFSFSMGIYADDASDYVTIENNLIYNLNNNASGELSTSIVLKGTGDVARNNICANSNNKKGIILSSNPSSGTNTGISDNQVIVNNISYNCGNNVYFFPNYRNTRIQSADKNIYYDKTATQYYNTGVDAKTFENWQTTTGFDVNSINSDPLFMNGESCDFRFKHNSPAYNLGIKDIDLQNIGLQKDFAFANNNENPNKLFVRQKNEKVNKGSVAIRQGEKCCLETLLRSESGFVLENADITYASLAENIASVDQNGTVSGVSAGVAVINITASINGKSVQTNLEAVVTNEQYISFKDKDGNSVNDVSGLSNFSVCVHMFPKTYNTQLIVGVYSGEKLRYLKNYEINPNTSDYVATIENIKVLPNEKLRAFLWGENYNMKPIIANNNNS